MSSQTDNMAYNLYKLAEVSGVLTSKSKSPQGLSPSPGPSAPPVAKRTTKIPRPKNAFILFRQKYHASVVGEFKGKTNPEISKIIGQRWRALPQEEKNYWLRRSEEEKKEHSKKYPDYRYQPKRSIKQKQPSSTGDTNILECMVPNPKGNSENRNSYNSSNTLNTITQILQITKPMEINHLKSVGPIMTSSSTFNEINSNYKSHPQSQPPSSNPVINDNRYVMSQISYIPNKHDTKNDQSNQYMSNFPPLHFQPPSNSNISDNVTNNDKRRGFQQNIRYCTPTPTYSLRVDQNQLPSNDPPTNYSRNFNHMNNQSQPTNTLSNQFQPQISPIGLSGTPPFNNSQLQKPIATPIPISNLNLNLINNSFNNSSATIANSPSPKSRSATPISISTPPSKSTSTRSSIQTPSSPTITSLINLDDAESILGKKRNFIIPTPRSESNSPISIGSLYVTNNNNNDNNQQTKRMRIHNILGENKNINCNLQQEKLIEIQFQNNNKFNNQNNYNRNINLYPELSIKEKSDILSKTLNITTWKNKYNNINGLQPLSCTKKSRKTLLISIEGLNTNDFSKHLSSRLKNCLLIDTPFININENNNNNEDEIRNENANEKNDHEYSNFKNSTITCSKRTTNFNKPSKDFSQSLWKLHETYQQLLDFINNRFENIIIVNGYLIRMCDELSNCTGIPFQSSSLSSSILQSFNNNNDQRQQQLHPWIQTASLITSGFTFPDISIYLSSNKLIQGEISNFKLSNDSKLLVTGSYSNFKKDEDKTLNKIIDIINKDFF